ncbi:MAG: hypothetical protein JW942_06050 [Opitutales bacterium]|nr:hypothetical protein [Opitutales bacterium]
MKKFQFPLQAILTLRGLKQEQALELYAKSVRSCADRRGELIGATRRMENLEKLISEDGSARFSASMRQAYMKALDEARDETQKREKALEEAEKIKDKQLAEFLERKRQKEILEHLREKQLKEHLAESYRKEEIEIEDLVISRSGLAKTA